MTPVAVAPASKSFSALLDDIRIDVMAGLIRATDLAEAAGIPRTSLLALLERPPSRTIENLDALSAAYARLSAKVAAET